MQGLPQNRGLGGRGRLDKRLRASGAGWSQGDPRATFRAVTLPSPCAALAFLGQREDGLSCLALIPLTLSNPGRVQAVALRGGPSESCPFGSVV
jgi:hypothetical protein